jgi:hypothetical protein
MQQTVVPATEPGRLAQGVNKKSRKQPHAQ